MGCMPSGSDETGVSWYRRLSRPGGRELPGLCWTDGGFMRGDS